jgi:Na+/H+ antiporter NhaD/arsenite permease-like protein
MSAFAAVLSNIVSNVPAVLVFRPFIPHLPDPRHAWLTLAMSSTLAGNLTVLGSVANLIVIQRASVPAAQWSRHSCLQLVNSGPGNPRLTQSAGHL